MDLGTVGIWGGPAWYDDAQAGEAAEAAAELDELGYGALWLSGRFGSGVSPQYRRMLEATPRMVVASGIVSIWHCTPEQAAEALAELERDFPGRFLLGLGASHAPVVERTAGDEYRRPYSRMVAYLDELDAQGGVPRDRRVLAALGDRMLALARNRAAGAHPYFVPVGHTSVARKALGDGPLLAPEQAVVLETDPDRARAIARTHTQGYLRLPNYTNNLRRLGFGDEDLEGAGSDRLVDAIVAWGDAETVAQRVRAHHLVGASHVCVQVVPEDAQRFPREEYRQLAAALEL